MPGNAVQDAWVRRVLGVSVGASIPPAVNANAARARLMHARDAMTEALAKADAQIRKLQAVLSVHPDPDLKEIAGAGDFGINGLTGGYRVRLLVAMREVDAASADTLQAPVEKLRKVVAGFDSYTRDSDRLAACDGNPFGVPVSVRALLRSALAELARSADALAA